MFYPGGKMSSNKSNAYTLLVSSLKDYRPRYRLTQPGLNERERLELKLNLFRAFVARKELLKDEY